MTKLRFKGAILLAGMSICSLSFLNVRQAMAFNNPFRISFFNSDENGESEGGESEGESEGGESEGESEGGDSNIRKDHKLKDKTLSSTEFKTEIGSDGIKIEYKRTCQTLVLYCGYDENKTCHKDSEKVISASCGNWVETK